MLTEAFDLLDELESTSSRNEKEAIIAKGIENDTFREILELAYNPFKMYNIVKFGDVTPTYKEPNIESFKRFKNHLELLTARILTGSESISTVTAFFNTLGEREYKWYSRVLKKDLRAGITSSTINKVFKKVEYGHYHWFVKDGLIPVFDCMLAKPWEDVKKKPKEVIIDAKLDGYRNVAFNDKSVELFTRNGKPILGFKDVENELRELPKGFVYDGELVGKENQFEDMQKLVFNKKLDDKKANFVIFDIIPIEEFQAGQSTATQEERKLVLAEMKAFYDLENIQFETGSPVYDPEKDWEIIEGIYERVLEAGYEGIMIKDANAKYVTKRSSAWAKHKPFETADLEIVGSVEGTKKNVGKLGALVVDWKGYEVEVGSGFSDEEREDLWSRRNELVGKIIEVQYQNETSNEKGTVSLRFPSFKGFREDKEGTITS